MSTNGTEPAWYKAVGITLALASGLFIGSSFIFKKKGLLDTNALGHEPGHGHAYLKSGMWWTGMILMALGEVFNFGAYAFTPAILVTPLGALSVVISAILSSIFLKERLNFPGKIGCAQCLLGAVIIVIHAPHTNSTQTIPEFIRYVLSPGFIVYSILNLIAVLYLVYRVAPKYGDKHPVVYISVCSMVGAFLVLSTQGFGSSVVYSIANWQTDNQFKQWPIYLVFAFVILTITVQINFLNKALNLFSTAIVTPVYYVFFTTWTLISSAVLFRGFPLDNAVAGVSIVIGFLVIVGGVALLFQYSLKLTQLSKLDAVKVQVVTEEQEGSEGALGGFGGDNMGPKEKVYEAVDVGVGVGADMESGMNDREGHMVNAYRLEEDDGSQSNRRAFAGVLGRGREGGAGATGSKRSVSGFWKAIRNRTPLSANPGSEIQEMSAKSPKTSSLSSSYRYRAFSHSENASAIKRSNANTIGPDYTGVRSGVMKVVLSSREFEPTGLEESEKPHQPPYTTIDSRSVAATGQITSPSPASLSSPLLEAESSNESLGSETRGLVEGIQVDSGDGRRHSGVANGDGLSWRSGDGEAGRNAKGKGKETSW
ncbi:hypothetical protein HK097_008737 [Rhizophlyctis rosea]|uniref:DUF803-domain-containing protein n=1 Tax=Rhizophlyctis rosea TaxID=64517 RepID=A0AAD5SL45_9FUNG|nr:hypothetical protein HK097_008737 [Rhizophlyctis rosea]